jgi:hypothetical protein
MTLCTRATSLSRRISLTRVNVVTRCDGYARYVRYVRYARYARYARYRRYRQFGQLRQRAAGPVRVWKERAQLSAALDRQDLRRVLAGEDVGRPLGRLPQRIVEQVRIARRRNRRRVPQ